MRQGLTAQSNLGVVAADLQHNQTPSKLDLTPPIDSDLNPADPLLRILFAAVFLGSHSISLSPKPLRTLANRTNILRSVIRGIGLKSNCTNTVQKNNLSPTLVLTFESE
jgi:hypothetical protein